MTIQSVIFLHRLIISIHTSAREVTPLYCICTFAPRFQSTLPQGKWLISFPSFPMIYIFQSTLPQGKWLNAAFAVSPPAAFQSTLPQGKWPCAVMAYVDTNDFNPHFRKGSDLLLQELTGFHCKFQSTLPQGKWHTREKQKMRHPDFNPHFRKGSDASPFGLNFVILVISIHTSAREVTFLHSA